MTEGEELKCSLVSALTSLGWGRQQFGNSEVATVAGLREGKLG